MNAWPDVDRDQYGAMICPVIPCSAELYLLRSYSIALYAELEPGHEASDAVADSWQVECTNGHVLWTSADRAREVPDADETADEAIEYDHMSLHRAINRLEGERL